MSYDELMSEYQKSQENYGDLNTEYKKLQNNYSNLEEAYKKSQNDSNELHQAYKRIQIENENLQLQLNNLKKVVFGVRREHTPKNEQLEHCTQCSLFDMDKVDDKIKKQVEEQTEEITVYKKKKSKTKKAGIKKNYLNNVEVEIKEYKINEEENCPKCESELKEISKDVVRQEITYVPAKLVLTNYVQYTYKCTKCGGNNSENTSVTIVKTQLPKPLLTHSFVSPSLATEVIYQKYYMGVPLYRQEKVWDDRGLILPRNMMANWNIKITEYYLNHLYNLMLKKIKSNSELLHIDETTIQCNKEIGRKASSNSYMWVLRSGELENEKGVIFKYDQSRSRKVAEEFLNSYTGILVTDGYAAYNHLEGITHVECWAHARRYFYESIPLNEYKELDTTATGFIGVTYCNKLFEIEREIALLSVPEKQKIRLEKSKPILEEFFEWVNFNLTEKIIVNNKLKEALNYASNQRKELSEFLNDGRIPLTNSLCERAIRPFAVHRKNWLFADSVEGAKTNAVMYSLIESAKINNLNIYKYINYLLSEIPQFKNVGDEKLLEKLLPWSKDLPQDIMNFDGEYKELTIGE